MEEKPGSPFFVSYQFPQFRRWIESEDGKLFLLAALTPADGLRVHRLQNAKQPVLPKRRPRRSEPPQPRPPTPRRTLRRLSRRFISIPPTKTRSRQFPPRRRPHPPSEQPGSVSQLPHVAPYRFSLFRPDSTNFPSEFHHPPRHSSCLKTPQIVNISRHTSLSLLPHSKITYFSKNNLFR